MQLSCKTIHPSTRRVIVEHMVYPVTLDVIFQIFSRVGKVMKIVTFTKNNTFQVYILGPQKKKR